MEQFTQDQQDNIIEGIQPICLILMKARVYIYWPGEVVIYMNQPQLRKLAFKIINSTTKLLPLWHTLLLQFKLPAWLIPQDVSTRWNSTFDLIFLFFPSSIRVPLMQSLGTGKRSCASMRCLRMSGKWQASCETS